MNTAFTQLTPAKTKAFLKRLEKADPGHNLCEDQILLLCRDLPFAPGWQRIDCEDHSDIPHRKRIFLAEADRLVPLVYTSDPLRDVFAALPLALDRDTVMDYLTLYMTALTVGGDKLRVITSVDDVAWREDLSPMVRKSLDRDLAAYPLVDEKTDGYGVKFAAAFRQAFMIVTCSVSRQGLVTISDRAVIADDLTVTSALTGI